MHHKSQVSISYYVYILTFFISLKVYAALYILDAIDFKIIFIFFNTTV